MRFLLFSYQNNGNQINFNNNKKEIHFSMHASVYPLISLVSISVLQFFEFFEADKGYYT